MEQQATGAATDRGADSRVLEVQAGDRCGGRVGTDRGSGCVGRGLLRFVVFLGDGICHCECFVARGFARGTLGLRLVAEQRAFSLLQRSPVGARVDLEENLTGGDFVALVEIDVQDRTVDLREDVDGANWLDGTGGFELVGQGTALDARDAHRNLGDRPAPARATPHRRQNGYGQRRSSSHAYYTHILLTASFRP